MNDYVYAVLVADRIRELTAEADNARLVRTALGDQPSWSSKLRALAGRLLPAHPATATIAAH